MSRRDAVCRVFFPRQEIRLLRPAVDLFRSDDRCSGHGCLGSVWRCWRCRCGPGRAARPGRTTRPCRAFYYYPYYYFPASYWPQNSPQWPEPKGQPYVYPPAYQAYPPFKEPGWHYELWTPMRYYRGNHFFLDQF